MHAVFSQYKAAWLPQFERLLPKVNIVAHFNYTHIHVNPNISKKL